MATKQQLIARIIDAAQKGDDHPLFTTEGTDVIIAAAKTGSGWVNSDVSRHLLVVGVRRALGDAAYEDAKGWRPSEYYQCWEALTVEGLRRILAFIENQSDNRNEDN